MKKFLIAAFFGILGMCGTEMPVMASNESSSSFDGNDNDDDNDDLDSSQHGANVQQLLEGNPKGLPEGNALNRVTDEVYARLASLPGFKEIKDRREQDIKTVIKVCLSGNNGDFNIPFHIGLAKKKGAKIEFNIGTIAEIILYMLDGSTGNDKVTAKKITQMKGSVLRNTLFPTIGKAVAGVIKRKEFSKDVKLDNYTKIINDFNGGLKSTTGIIENLSGDNLQDIIIYVSGENSHLSRDVTMIENTVSGLKFDSQGKRRNGKEKEPEEIRTLKANMLELLDALKSNLQKSLCRDAVAGKKGLFTSLRYLQALQTATDDSRFLGAGKFFVTPSTLLDFYILNYSDEGYNNPNFTEWNEETFAGLNRQIASVLQDEELAERAKEVFYPNENGEPSNNIADYLITEEVYNTCVNAALEAGKMTHKEKE